MPNIPLKLPAWLGNNAVLQAGMLNSIQGTAAPGAQVSILLEKLDEVPEFSALAKKPVTEGRRKVFDQDLLTDVETGRFTFRLPEIEASFSTYCLTLTYDGYDYCFNDIYFGEVWVAAGESNMVMPVIYSDLRNDLHTIYNTKGLRFFLPNESGLRRDERKYSIYERSIIPGANWFDTSDRINTRRVSAVAASFAYGLVKALDCPVGIYDIACNDTCIHAWFPWVISDEDEEISRHVKYLGHYREAKNYNVMSIEDPIVQERRVKHEREKNSVYRHIPFSLRNQPGAIYNHKLAPLKDLGIRGMIWYQGESDALYPEYYSKAFKYFGELIQAIFRTPGEKLSLIYSQLAPYYYSSEDPYALAVFNEVLTASRHMFSTMPHLQAGMVTVYDLSLEYSDKKDHQIWARPLNPIAKKEIGRRMSEVALGLAYKSILPARLKTCDSAPEFVGADLHKHGLTLKFNNTAEGIMKQASYGELSGFSAADQSGIFVPCITNSVLGMQAVLRVNSVREPVMCNYAFSTFNQEASCYNSKGIPLVPFRIERSESHNYMPSMPWMYCNSTKIWALPPKDEIEGITDSSKIPPKERDLWKAVSGKITFSLSREDYNTSDASLEVNYRRMGEKPVVFGPVLDYASLYPPLDISMWREIKIVFKNKTRCEKQIGLRVVSRGKEINLGAKKTSRPFSWEEMSFLISDLNPEDKQITSLYITVEDEKGEGVIFIDRITFEGLIKY